MTFSYAIIGAGALGGYYGSRLEAAGCSVHYLMRSDYDHVAAHGLIVESMHGEKQMLRPKIYRQATQLPKCDVVVVGTKSTGNDALPDLLPHAMRDDSVVLMLQNGLGVDEVAAEVVGADRVIGGLCFLCSNRLGPGHIKQSRFDHMMIGQFASLGITERMRQIASDFGRGSVRVDLAENLGLARWKKLVWNVPYNGLCAVLDRDTSEVMQHPETAKLCRELMVEVATAAEYVGQHRIEPAFIEKMLENTQNMDRYLPSMQIDRREGRPMEVEAIHGEPARQAEWAGCSVPRMTMLYQQLSLLNSKANRR